MFSFFRKKRSENYEEILEELAVSISNRQTRLTELALRERRSALWAAIYTLLVWACYSFVWYLDLLPTVFEERTRSNVEIERVVLLAPVLIGPVVALFLRRIIQAWYRRKGAAEEATLKKLLVKQRTTIEEIKKKTNYYSTRNLIERYDQQPGAPQTPQNPRQHPQDPTSQLRQRPRPSGVGPPGQFGTPGGPQAPNDPRTPAQTPARPSGMKQTPSFSATPPAPPQRQWFDKVADALLGADDNAAASLDPAKSRYALICARCSAHNGLVLESMWEDTQYICPKCGHFNPAPRTLKSSTLTSAISPSSPSDAAGRSSILLGDPHARGRLPQPNFLAPDVDGSPSRSRSRTSGRSEVGGSDMGDTTMDAPTVDRDATPEVDRTEGEGDVSVMQVDEDE